MKNLTFALIILILAFFSKWLLWDLNVSSGKMIGKIQEINQKNFLFIKNWEGILWENGKSIPFSVKDNRIGLELLKIEGNSVILYYNRSLLSWPRKTDISVTGWRFLETGIKKSEILSVFEKSLFCTFLGSLLNNKDLYLKVKDFIKTENIYLYNQIPKCND
jgi:hypothetical protein